MPVVALLLTLVVLAVLVLGVLYWRRQGYSGPGRETIVRCREGHLFTTVWIPGMSFKAIRLGMMRVQRCPVGNHLTFVVPVKESELTDEEKRIASEYHDTRIP
jgi:hypothetical protein